MPASDWPIMAEAGAGLSEPEFDAQSPMVAPGERSRQARFNLIYDVRKRPLIYFGVGVLIGMGLATAIARSTRSNLHAELRA